MMGSLHKFPGQIAAANAAEDPKTPDWIRSIAVDMTRDTNPADLLWAAPGTRLRINDRSAPATCSSPCEYCDEIHALSRDDDRAGGAVALMLVAVCLTLPLAFYGAVKLGGELVRLMLGVQ